MPPRFATATRALLLTLLAVSAAACGDDEPGAPVAPTSPTLTTLSVVVTAASMEAGQTATASVVGLDQSGNQLTVGTVTWTSSSATVATITSNGVVTATGGGTTQITATVDGKTAQQPLTVTVAPAVRINEVESNGGIPGDWVELYNPTAASVNIGGWRLRDNDSTRTFRFPEGTVIPPGGYFVAEEALFDFGLGAADEVRLLSRFGVPVDQYSWTSHATSTYGRCPTASSGFVTTTSVTKGEANDCRPMVKVNEVESNGGTPGDWIELYNAGTTVIDLSNFLVKDNDDTRTTRLPAGSTIAPGAFFLIEEATLGFGLGAADAARLYDASGVLIDSYSWTAHATTSYGRCPDGSGGFTTTTAVTKGVANDCRAAVKINEVESSGGVPGDWIELYNTGLTPLDLSGFLVKDNDDTRTTTLPAGTTIAPGGIYVIEETVLGFGLGAADAARLYDRNGALLDSYTWTAHATTTYGRCPDGTGTFTTTSAPTKGVPNDCGGGGGGGGGTPAATWPGSDDVRTVDGTSVFGGNMSGLTYEPAAGAQPAVLWAARNGPGALFRLVSRGGTWTPDTANGWGSGKGLRYTDNTGDADAEGVTFAGTGSTGGLYVASERNNAANSVSRNSILRFDPAQAGATLRATNDWNITGDLPAVGANLGIEAITWIPDSMLVARGFRDEAKGRAYAPSDYPDHGTGLFFVGVEANGTIYAYALNHVTNGFTRVATITTGYPGVMGLEYDRETGYLWATCDDGCGNIAGVLELDVAAGSSTRGTFLAPRRFARPTTMPNINNEGFAFAPGAECVAGRKPVFWADDSETGGHAIRAASIPCGAISSSLLSPFTVSRRLP
ncbi:MAG: lamin tail domain-containing protein [Gemmatimonadetes bacterium]|nr:lamin tail domain-containing protein [Gemmatimonadota bacterium]